MRYNAPPSEDPSSLVDSERATGPRAFLGGALRAAEHGQRRTQEKPINRQTNFEVRTLLGWAPLVVFTPQMNVVVPVSLLWYVEVPSHMLPKHSSGQVLRKFRPLYWFGQAAVQALSGSPQRLLIYMAAGVGKRPWWAI